MQAEKPVLHLMVTKDCHLDCPLCCNKQYNIDEIPVVTVEDFRSVDTVCITGGEPFLVKPCLAMIITMLRRSYKNIERLYIYTTGKYMSDLGPEVDGLSIGPKNKDDWHVLINKYQELKREYCTMSGSNRLYVFPEQRKMFDYISYIWPDFTEVLNVDVFYRKWQKQFEPAPNSIFRRLPMFY